jgi:hypothetical protein
MLERDGAQSTREARLAAVHERLAGAVESLVSGDDWQRAIQFAARFRTRSFGNTLLIWSQHQAAYEAGRVPDPEPTFVAGFKQWQLVGRTVKGQAGYVIHAPVTALFATSTPQIPESWRRLGRLENPRPGKVVRSRMIGAKPAYVWDVSQTGGGPLPERPHPVLLTGTAPDGLWEGLAAQIHGHGFTVERVPDELAIHGANGLTDYTAKTVAVRSNMDDAAQVKTLAHELAHVLLHAP